MNILLKRLLFLPAVFVLFTPVSLADERVNWIVKADEMNRNAVVCIEGDKTEETGNSYDSGSSAKSFNGMGTGIVIDEKGYIVTNYHVVDGLRKIQVLTYNRKQYVAMLVARDPDTDIAIIRINANEPLQTIRVGRSDDLMPGEYCLAIGNPYGYPFTVTTGLISGLLRKVDVNDSLSYHNAIQVSAQINPGNSGGPLLNVHGEMIGMNAAIRAGAECIAFAIPVGQVVEVAAKLFENLVKKNVYLGAVVSQKESVGNSNGRFSERQSFVIVDSVDANSPAEAAGLQKGDRIVSIGGKKVNNKLDFYRSLVDIASHSDIVFETIKSGDSNDETGSVTISLAAARDYLLARDDSRGRNVRSGVPSRADITAKTAVIQPKTAAIQPKTVNVADEHVWQTLGISYEPMKKDEYRRQFADYLSKYPYGGIVVKAVKKDTEMARKGVMPGDVIVGIHEWAVTSESDVRFVAKEWNKIKSPSNKVQLWLFRDDSEFFTELSLR
ncbi:MAG: trypsin-like peptidase domain-containing protein [Planctomycetaceae bacterium]|nr:trypsin-like peptidase domain-containing protein [Planctomycetaceae bacterium]